MTKIQSLTKYREELKNRLDAPVPEKHLADNGVTYRVFLKREIDTVSKRIDELKLVGAK